MIDDLGEELEKAVEDLEDVLEELDEALDELEHARVYQQVLEHFQVDPEALNQFANAEENDASPMPNSSMNSQPVSDEEPQSQRSSLGERLSSKIARMGDKLDFMLTTQRASQNNPWPKQNVDLAVGEIMSILRQFIDAIPKAISAAVNDELKKCLVLTKLLPEHADFRSGIDDVQLKFQLSPDDEISYKQAMNEAPSFSQLPSEGANEEPEMATKQAEPESDPLVKEREDAYEALAEALMEQAKENEERARNEPI